MSGFIEARGAKRKVIAINQQLLALVGPLLLQTNTGNEPPPPQTTLMGRRCSWSSSHSNYRIFAF